LPISNKSDQEQFFKQSCTYKCYQYFIFALKLYVILDIYKRLRWQCRPISMHSLPNLRTKSCLASAIPGFSSQLRKKEKEKKKKKELNHYQCWDKCSPTIHNGSIPRNHKSKTRILPLLGRATLHTFNPSTLFGVSSRKISMSSDTSLVYILSPGTVRVVQ